MEKEQVLSPSESVYCRGRKWELKETVRCVFCRGVNCKRCGSNAYLNAISPAIENFHCNWITNEILAMQRPSDEQFETINLLEQFKLLNITAVLNLTEPGEHPFCGYGIKESGFPYSPEKLMAVGIKHFNFAWRDMTAPTLSLTQNIVRVGMAELLSGGKVAVHCHAGYGRTGIVVTCLVMARNGKSSDEAVQLVRSQRPGSVQTSAQLEFVREFEREYHFQKSVYPIISTTIKGSQDDTSPEQLSTIILSKPPRRKESITESIHRRMSIRRLSHRDKVLPASNSPFISISSLPVSPSPQVSVSPLTTPSTSPSPNSPSKLNSSPIYIQLKTIDMSIIDEKLSNIEHSHPHHEISSKQLIGQETVHATDVNYYNQYSSMILQIIIKIFRSISQVYHPLYLSSILCGYVNNQMIEDIHSSLLSHQRINTHNHNNNQENDNQNNNNYNYNQDSNQDNNELKENNDKSNIQESSYSIVPLTEDQNIEINNLLNNYKVKANQNQWKIISEITYMNSISSSSSSVPVIQESVTQDEEDNIHNKEVNSNILTLPVPQFNLVNCLTLSHLYFDWLDTRLDSLFTNQFLSLLISENIITLSQSANNSSNTSILSSRYYFIPSHLLPPSTINADNNQNNNGTPTNQQINKVHPSKDQEAKSTQNLLDIFLRKNLSRTKLSLLEDMLTLYHQFDTLSPELFNQYRPLILATEIRIALSCLEETHNVLLNQLLGTNNSIISSKEESPSFKSTINEEQSSSLLSLLYQSRQMNITFISSLLTSGVIHQSKTSTPTSLSTSTSSPFILSFPSNSQLPSLPSNLSPSILKTLSNILLVINLFHTLVSVNWIATKRNVKNYIRWRRSFAEEKAKETSSS